ncbi:hypothetical protein H9Y04_16110 [Streptomyces sp. TRM66268-LWL]|uniref:Uncharacterized protein n=1 Tax=Streptomyces polyasparticus TaxID=2767826 RepID=A0ABR7SIF1_9ACTN|nr:hypothetical protein [Streptomyces polyasparticus]MBC9714088.1 hypothetical protein [Streptomyces polyasparticus]
MRVGITGHRGLGEQTEKLVKGALLQALDDLEPTELCLVSCIADGPDAWAAEAALDLGGRIEVVIPAAQYRDSLPTTHHATYDRLLAAAVEVHETGMVESTEHAHMAGSEILVGLVDRLYAVWDGQPARGYGGTADVVDYARSMGVPVTVLWPDGASRD